ncbi:MAG: hypothetical protein R3E89_18130 [Thiolinea sp.]
MCVLSPQQALAAGADGLDDIRILIATAPAYLHSRPAATGTWS